MKNKRKLLILLGALVFTPFMISAHAAMVDPLAVDCRTGFITGSLWAGKAVPEEQIVLTLEDIGEPKKSKIPASVTQGEDPISLIDTMLGEMGAVLEEVSLSRGEEDSYRVNIRSFLKILREVAVSLSAKPETIERMLGIIFTKYAG